MADKLSSQKRSWNMSRIKGKNTKPELLIRRCLFARGIRYRINYKLEGKPDLVFPKNKIAVFIHGCFWHQHGCKNTYRPKTRKTFWNNKLDKNIERDILVNKKLIQEGWKIIYVWECEIKKDLEASISKITDLLNEESNNPC